MVLKFLYQPGHGIGSFSKLSYKLGPSIGFNIDFCLYELGINLILKSV
jgi:hypothetical protein